MIGDGKIPRWYCVVEKAWDVAPKSYCKTFLEGVPRRGHESCGRAWRDPLGRVHMYDYDKRGKVDK